MLDTIKSLVNQHINPENRADTINVFERMLDVNIWEFLWWTDYGNCDTARSITNWPKPHSKYSHEFFDVLFNAYHLIYSFYIHEEELTVTFKTEAFENYFPGRETNFQLLATFYFLEARSDDVEKIFSILYLSQTVKINYQSEAFELLKTTQDQFQKELLKKNKSSIQLMEQLILGEKEIKQLLKSELIDILSLFTCEYNLPEETLRERRERLSHLENNDLQDKLESRLRNFL